MKFIVNDIRFDFSGSDDVTMNEKIDITDDSLGLWDADDEDDLIPEIGVDGVEVVHGCGLNLCQI